MSAALTGVLLISAPLSAHAAHNAERTPAAEHSASARPAAAGKSLTVATVDAGLSSERDGDIVSQLRQGDDARAEGLARTLQQTRPDVVVLTNVDVDAAGDVVDALRSGYLEVPQDGSGALEYPYAVTGTSNAGVPSGADLDNDGAVGDAGDALGYGAFEGQGSMVVLSRLPIDQPAVRTFTNLTWASAPDSHIGERGYSQLIEGMLPLASTSLWDVPVTIQGTTVHIVATSATSAENAPGADALRQRDQMRLLKDYVENAKSVSGLADDQDRRGGLLDSSAVVVAGNLGADAAGESASSLAVRDVVKSPLLTDPVPGVGGTAVGGFGWMDPLYRVLSQSRDATRLDENSTSRQDYVLPAKDLKVTGSGLRDVPSQDADSQRLVWVSVDL